MLLDASLEYFSAKIAKIDCIVTLETSLDSQ